jgi:hypothetical protein
MRLGEEKVMSFYSSSSSSSASQPFNSIARSFLHYREIRGEQFVFIAIAKCQKGGSF